VREANHLADVYRSFARDGGIPFHTYFAKVSEERQTPVRATMFTLVITSLLSLFNTVSAVALSTLTSLSLTGLISSYLLVVVSVLSRRVSGQKLLPTRFDLGKLSTHVEPSTRLTKVAGRKFGFFCNTVALVFLSVVLGKLPARKSCIAWPLTLTLDPQ